jgi:iron complex outermembrane receptor protein
MDVLKRIPGLGISINNIGIPIIEVRGVRTDFSEKVLLLKNGYAINNNIVNGGATTSHSNFLIDDIKRIEVVIGPGSALYGANAFVAVINIITKTAKDIDGTQVSLSLGDNETRKVNILTGQHVNNVDVAFNATFFDTDGHREFVESDSLTNSGEANDWNKNFEFGLNLDYSNFSFQGQYLKRESGAYIGIANALNDESEQDYSEYFLEIAYKNVLSEELTLSQTLYNNNFKLDNFWEIFPEGFISIFPNGLLALSYITMETFGAEFQLEYTLNQHKLILGLLAEHQSIFDVGFKANYDPTSNAPLPSGFQDIYDTWPWISNEHRDLQAVYIQDIWDINSSLRLIVGSRYDHYSDVGGSFNPRTSLSWGFSDASTITISYGTAFRAPNFGELHNMNNPLFVGNPDLNPEEIETYELSLGSQLSKRTEVRATMFKNNISELIELKSGTVNNAGHLEVNGLEFELNSRSHDGSSLGFNYTYQYAQDKDNGRRSSDIPMHIVNTAYTHRYSRFLSAYLGLNYRGKMPRSAGDNRSDTAEHATVDFALNIKSVDKNTHIKLSIYNLFNEAYADAAQAGTVSSDFPKPGRNFMFEVSQKL